MKRSAALFLFEAAQTFGVDDMIIGKVFASRSNAGEDGANFYAVAKIALLIENIISITNSVTNALKTFGDFLT